MLKWSNCPPNACNELCVCGRIRSNCRSREQFRPGKSHREVGPHPRRGSLPQLKTESHRNIGPQRQRPAPRRRSLPLRRRKVTAKLAPTRTDQVPATLPRSVVVLMVAVKVSPTHSDRRGLATVGNFCCGFLNNKMPRVKIVDFDDASGSANPRVPARGRVAEGCGRLLPSVGYDEWKGIHKSKKVPAAAGESSGPRQRKRRKAATEDDDRWYSEVALQDDVDAAVGDEVEIPRDGRS
ncbi:hypothetical protein LWI29_019104 [Acer saccharum]|uniref:Uncharacterized protein n=1 Tax=Acer saccharum TaxID=4024 RepID=A0AA39VZG3_ACESA|nr:hypothetical protein LWI29_019104 [Acer saccharum]